jgi:hypothetical protein
MTLTSKEIRDTLEDPNEFRNLCSGFVRKVIRERNAECEYTEEAEFNVLEAVTSLMVDSIEEHGKSPIERIFLRSLLLGAIRNGSLGILVFDTFENAEEEIISFRDDYNNFKEFVSWAEKQGLNTDQMYKYLDQELKQGHMNKDEREYLDSLMFKYYLVNLENCFHMSLQPKLFSYVRGKRYIQPDILFWLPRKPEVKVIVECDGYKYHSGKHEFTSDRIRDRELQKAGYKVLRYSGAEIFHDPVGVSRDIHEYLYELNPTKLLPP